MTSAKYLPQLKRPKIFLIRRVKGMSMNPTLADGQIVIASSLANPKPNALVILDHKGLEKIKRLKKISEDKIYVVGDNQNSSSDSKQFGWIPMSSLTATVVWPNYKQNL